MPLFSIVPQDTIDSHSWLLFLWFLANMPSLQDRLQKGAKKGLKLVEKGAKKGIQLVEKGVQKLEKELTKPPPGARRPAGQPPAAPSTPIATPVAHHAETVPPLVNTCAVDAQSTSTTPANASSVTVPVAVVESEPQMTFGATSVVRQIPVTPSAPVHASKPLPSAPSEKEYLDATLSVLRPKPFTPDPNITYDVQFFRNWLVQLKQQVVLPDDSWKQNELWVDALTTTQSSWQAWQQAVKTRDDLSKKKPANEDEMKAANEACNSLESALEQVKETEAQVGGDVLESTPSLQSLFSDDYDDGPLLQATVLLQATPKAFAEWCARSETATTQLLSCLYDTDFLRLVVANGGARNQQYGRMMEIYYQLPYSPDPVLQRLALAVALELAENLCIFDTKQPINAVQRYIHYEQAYLLGELDPAFPSFTIWEMRSIVNCDASNEELGWGRQSLMNYRPDLVYSSDPKWRYCQIVRADVSYNTPDWYKKPRTYDQILSGGGKCGPRAWYGRFSCKAFGIPTWGCRQPGHAAMVRWTSDGWMTCLGAGMKFSNWEGRTGLDFEWETKARKVTVDEFEYYRLVGRLELIAIMKAEKANRIRQSCLTAPESPWWSISLLQRKHLSKRPIPECAPVDPSTLSAAPNQIAAMIKQPEVCEATRLGDNGSIIIPAASWKGQRKGSKTTDMKSFLGGHQSFLSKDAIVAYQVSPEFLKSGRYQLQLRLNTAHRNEEPMKLTVKSDGAATDYIVPIPYTKGLWQLTEPVEIAVGKDLEFSLARQSNRFGISLKDITLTPL